MYIQYVFPKNDTLVRRGGGEWWFCWTEMHKSVDLTAHTQAVVGIVKAAGVNVSFPSAGQ